MPPDSIQFDTQESLRAPAAASTSAITGLLMRLGLAKDEKAARSLLAIVAVIAIVAALSVLFFTGGHAGPTRSDQDRSHALTGGT